LTDGNLELSEALGAGTSGGIAYVQQGHTGHTVNGTALPPRLAPGQKVFDYFPWLTAVLVVPLVAIFELPGLVGLKRFDVDTLIHNGDTGLLALIGGATLTAIAMTFLTATAWRLLKLSPQLRRRAALTVGVVAALGTSAWSTLSRALWSQTTAVLMVSGVLFACTGILRRHEQGETSRPRDAAIAGVLAGAAVAARPTGVMVLSAVGLWLLITERRQLIPFVSGAACSLAIWVAVNLWAYGQLLAPYYSLGRAGFGGGMFGRLAEDLVSPNRGLLIFSPVVVLSVAGAVLAFRGRGPLPRAFVACLVLAVCGHLLAVSGSGLFSGASYGPRYTADLIPVLVVLALPAVEAIFGSPQKAIAMAALVLAGVSVLMHAPGAISKPSECWNAVPNDISSHQGRVWDWTDLQALRGVRVLRETGSVRDALLQGCDAQVAKIRAGTR
jgi:hypothetical protein